MTCRLDVVNSRSTRICLGSALLVMTLTMSTGARAATPANARSPVGMNLQGVSYYSSEQPFLNIFKTAGGWWTHTSSQWDTGEERYLDLDADGYPISLRAINDPKPQQFTSLGVLLLRDLPETPSGRYPAGKYLVLYDGQGTIAYSFDASLIRSSAGRDEINVATPTNAGIYLEITATDPHHNGNYIRNIRVVKAENESALKAGQIFNPSFLRLLGKFRALRFMDWFQTNGNNLSSWSDRALPGNAFWGTAKGVPIETAIQLANAVSADAWFTVPVKADDDYVTKMATLIHDQLGASQRAYVELSNEVWNGSFPQNAYSIAQGQAAFPGLGNKWYAGWEWYGMRTARIADIWYGVFGSSFNTRVTVVMAGQAGNPTVLEKELATPDWIGAGNRPAAAHHIGAAAIAPYFGSLPSADCVSRWLAQPDHGLAALFQSLYSQNDASVPAGGYLAQALGFLAPNLAVTAPYKIPMLAYEGGQGFQGFPNYLDGSGAVKLLLSANRDPRMGTAYTAMLHSWKSNGGTLFMHFNDTTPANQYGEWGALESLMQITGTATGVPPKWQAIEDFIATTPCWWAGCGGTSGPAAP